MDQLLIWVNQFHFLRPLSLLLLLPLAVILLLLWRQQRPQGSWHNVIAPELLQHLLHEKDQKTNHTPLWLLTIGWVLASLAIAGPTWTTQPVPVSKSEQPLVVAVDLSLYMLAADVKPDRMTRAKFKLQDLIRLQQDGEIALVSYAGSAHTVAPLTDDDRTLINLIKALNPTIMPVQGNKPAEAIKLALQLLKQGSSDDGEILLVTGTLSPEQQEQINKVLSGHKTRLSILGVGTAQGAPIPLPEGGYLKDHQGSIIVPRLAKASLTQLARAHGGVYRDMTVSDNDLKALLPQDAFEDDVVLTDKEFDQWHDAGYWLVLLLLPLALMGFRRGWLTVLFIVCTLPTAPDAMALSWNDLWQTADQQGQKSLNAGDAAQAAELFTNKRWKAQSLFQQQKYDEAARLFGEGDSADDAFNQGNALAKAGKLQEALEAYDRALERQPDFEDANSNHKLVEDLLKQQEQKQDEQNQQNQNQDKQGQDKQQNSDGNNEQENSEENKEQQQNSEDGENQNQQNSDQKSSDQQQNGQQEQSPQQDGQQTPEDSNQTKEQPDQPKQQQTSSDAQQDTQQPAEEKSAEQQAKQPSTPEDEQQSEPASQQPIAIDQDDSASTPEKQAVESWLRTIPDDPGGLLRRKFLQQQQQREQAR